MPYGTMEASYKDAETLSTLTSEQALADFATLVVDLKRNLSAEASPVVLFGGSYGGSRFTVFFISFSIVVLDLLLFWNFPCSTPFVSI